MDLRKSGPKSSTSLVIFNQHHISQCSTESPLFKTYGTQDRSISQPCQTMLALATATELPLALTASIPRSGIPSSAPSRSHAGSLCQCCQPVRICELIKACLVTATAHYKLTTAGRHSALEIRALRSTASTHKFILETNQHCKSQSIKTE